MQNNWIEKAFLFKDIDCAETHRLLSTVNVEHRDYLKGESIFLPNDFDKRIGFIVSGECQIVKIRNNSEGIPLNTLSVGDAFGVIAVFTGCEEFPTKIFALRDSKIAFLNKNDVLNLMNNSLQISINIINFLADRICFLNNKITSFSGDNVEQKIALYILDLHKSTQDGIIKFNKKHAAESINIGRTSLYRALDSLEREGIIQINEKNIIIIDLDGLERKSK